VELLDRVVRAVARERAAEALIEVEIEAPLASALDVMCVARLMAVQVGTIYVHTVGVIVFAGKAAAATEATALAAASAARAWAAGKEWDRRGSRLLYCRSAGTRRRHDGRPSRVCQSLRIAHNRSKRVAKSCAARPSGE
jgi:hypothetical protein